MNEKFYDREHMERSLVKAFARDAGWDSGTCHVEWIYDEEDCILGARVIRTQTKAEKPLRWVTASGKVLELPQMETSHLINARAWLDETFLPLKKPFSAEWMWGIAMVKAFTVELEKRKA